MFSPKTCAIVRPLSVTVLRILPIFVIYIFRVSHFVGLCDIPIFSFARRLCYAIDTLCYAIDTLLQFALQWLQDITLSVPPSFLEVIELAPMLLGSQAIDPKPGPPGQGPGPPGQGHQARATRPGPLGWAKASRAFNPAGLQAWASKPWFPPCGQASRAEPLA